MATIGHPDVVVSRSSWKTMAISLAVCVVLLVPGAKFKVDYSILLTILGGVGLMLAFATMPIVGANNLGVMVYRLYSVQRQTTWENIIDADLESYEGPFRLNGSSKIRLVLTFEDGENIKLGLDWHNMNSILELIQSRMPAPRISSKVHSLLETGSVPANV
jgi:hypothetical protein